MLQLPEEEFKQRTFEIERRASPPKLQFAKRPALSSADDLESDHSKRTKIDGASGEDGEKVWTNSTTVTRRELKELGIPVLNATGRDCSYATSVQPLKSNDASDASRRAQDDASDALRRAQELIEDVNAEIAEAAKRATAESREISLQRTIIGGLRLENRVLAYIVYDQKELLEKADARIALRQADARIEYEANKQLFEDEYASELKELRDAYDLRQQKLKDEYESRHQELEADRKELDALRENVKKAFDQEVL